MIPQIDRPVGILLIDKPAGPSSFTVVRRIRKILGEKKVGHAGTLDPFASGLLIVCVGRPATRLIEHFMEGRKRYQATLQLGVETDTMDPEGKVIARKIVPSLTEAEITSCLARFIGSQQQMPPMFSALKHQGKPLYHYARQDREVARAPREITVYSLENRGHDLSLQQLRITVSCSRGTYIRVLGSDIGRYLGCGASLIELRRMASGCFTTADSLDGNLLFDEDQEDRVKAALLPLEAVEMRLESCLNASASMAVT